jgi:hypothetical protein
MLQGSVRAKNTVRQKGDQLIANVLDELSW